mgnify:CR=1 FL=1
MNDADLIQRFIAGQPQVFNTLVWRWQGRFYNFVLRYAGNPEDARDLCQQRFIRAHRQRHRLRNPERFGTWLYQIAANLCRDHLRHRQSHTSLDAYQEENGQPHPALSDDTHDRATELLGQQALIELVAIAGFYSMIALTLNAFDVPIPEGGPPPLDD